MAYTNNDVQGFNMANAWDDTSLDTASDGFDSESWAALQQLFTPGAKTSQLDMSADPVMSAAKRGTAYVNKVTQATVDLTQVQAVANVHVLNDNFIRDNITGK